jgi:hypothetical protein
MADGGHIPVHQGSCRDVRRGWRLGQRLQCIRQAAYRHELDIGLA